MEHGAGQPQTYGPDLRAGERVPGPAVIEHPTTTVFVAGGQHAALDRLGNLELTITSSA